jgi:hypothetical protein
MAVAGSVQGDWVVTPSCNDSSQPSGLQGYDPAESPLLPDAAPGAPLCNPTELAASVGTQQPAGGTAIPVLVANNGATPCTLDADLSPLLLDAQGRSLAVSGLPPNLDPDLLHLAVVVASGASAYLALIWTHFCGPVTQPIAVQLTLLNNLTVTSAPTHIVVPRCALGGVSLYLAAFALAGATGQSVG